MSRLGKIGSFIRNTAQGVAELISAPFLNAQQAPSAKSSSTATASAAKARLLASYPRGAEIPAAAAAAESDPAACADQGKSAREAGNCETPAVAAESDHATSANEELLASEAGDAEVPASELTGETEPEISVENRQLVGDSGDTESPAPALVSESDPATSADEPLLASEAGGGAIPVAVAAASESAKALKGRTLSNEPYGPEFPASAVTRRYRALKAEGLTPKQASEFSHSAKKYAQYRTLSATRPYEGAETYWDALKDFDQKVEAHMQRMKQAAVLKQDILICKKEIVRARDLLIQKFVDGKDALTEENFTLIKKVAETIDAKYF